MEVGGETPYHSRLAVLESRPEVAMSLFSKFAVQ
jgi:hypothetical protein